MSGEEVAQVQLLSFLVCVYVLPCHAMMGDGSRFAEKQGKTATHALEAVRIISVLRGVEAHQSFIH